MEQRKLGKTGPWVGSFGLGCMGMSGMYGPADRAESVATIQESLDAGVTLFDTGDFYGMGHNEMLLAEALKGGRRDKAILSVKFGALRGPAGGWSGADGAAHCRQYCRDGTAAVEFESGTRHIRRRIRIPARRVSCPM